VPATYADHRAQLKAILRGWDMPEDNAEITAEVLAWSDLHGIDSHGISMIPRYDELRRKGRVRMDARPRIVSQTPVSAVVDGGGDGSPENSSYKGYGLAVMVNILASCVSGATLIDPEHTKKPLGMDIGHFFMAIDPAIFRGAGDFEADVATFWERSGPRNRSIRSSRLWWPAIRSGNWQRRGFAMVFRSVPD
jgi:LDH2 family malate/lactate/ureidoglycolate dehydrogenase